MPQALRKLVVVALVALVRLYQWLISPLVVALFGARCRFHPSCSQYAVEAMRHYGPLSGSWRAVKRVCRCHPYHPGGYDPPVPNRGSNG